MGRGKGTNEAQQSTTAVAELPASRATGDTRRADRALVDTLLNRLFKAAGDYPLGSDAANKAVYRNFGTLDAGKEAMLCRIAKEQPELKDKIKTIFILSNCMLAKKAAAAYRSFEGFEEEDFVSAAMFGLSQVIDRFDPTVGSAPTSLQAGDEDHRRFKAAPTTLGYGRMRGELTREARSMGHGSGFNPKSLGEIKRRTQIALKELENEGVDPSQITPQMIADRTNDSVKQVIEAMGLLRVQMVRLDGHVDTSDGAMTIGDAIADENAEFEESLLNDELRASIRAAVEEEGFLSPAERFIVTKYFGLDGDTPVGEKHFFDYTVLKDGKQYASEQAVVSDREQRHVEDPDDVNGTPVELISQRELTAMRLEDGAVVLPGTPEAAELMRILGTAPTQTRIQDLKKRALGKIGQRFEWMREDFTSRGRNAIEHSETIASAVRAELVRRAEESGALADAEGNTFNAADIARMKQPSRGGTSELRALAEHHGIVDKETGSLDPTALKIPLAVSAAPAIEQPASSSDETPTTQSETRPRPSSDRPKVAGSARSRSATNVTKLIESGALKKGEKIYATKTFDGVLKHFVAVLVGGETVRVISDGFDGSLEGQEFKSTSAAITACYRRPDTGWGQWKVDRNGQRVPLLKVRDDFDNQASAA